MQSVFQRMSPLQMQSLAPIRPRFTELLNRSFLRTLSLRAFSSSSSDYADQSRGGLPRFFSEALPPSKGLGMVNEKERSFLTNGGILLEDLIASSNGKCNPIRNFSAEELIRATNNFHPSYVIEHDCVTYDHLGCPSEEVTYYRGFLDDRTIIVKKYFTRSVQKVRLVRSQAIRDIVIATQMSNHKNVLKLLGCCLEFHVPALVHEYATNGALNDKGGFGDNEILPWKIMLRVAKELAHALIYLHIALSRPVIHRYIRPNWIFLDHNFVPKFCNFSLSITIPPEQSHAYDGLHGRFDGYSDPEYLKFGFVTKKSDVYSFGIILLMFLTRQKAAKVLNVPKYELLLRNLRDHVQNDQATEIVDPNILREGGGEQVEAFLALALACTQEEGEARLDMIDVAKELMRIEKLIIRK